MLRIALAQANFTVGDIKGNQSKILRWIEKARGHDVDLVAFPELSVSGYPPEDLLFRPRFLEDCRNSIEVISKKARGITAVIGFPNLSVSVHNSAGVIADSRLACVCNKIHLPNYGVFDEKRYFTPGKAASVIVIGDVRIGINICEDIWREDVTRAQVGAGGAQVILNISSSPYHVGKGSEREHLLGRRAISNRVYVGYVNLVGAQDELVFDGHSVVFDPGGRLVVRGRQFQEDLVIVDVDPAKAKRSGKPGTRPRSKRIPVKIFELKAGHRRRRKSVIPRIEEPLGPLEEVYEAIVTGTRDYVRKNRFKKVVVGLSGGIDSALVAAIAVDAMGKDRVIGVSMPSRYSSAASIRDARTEAGNLGIRLIKIGIDRVFSSYLRTLKNSFKGFGHDVTEENIQARIRGNILMALSNKFGWLVLTTGNKSELAAGYCTLYGDLAGGFAILKDVPKTLVYRLARFRNTRGVPVIPEQVLTKAPSAELRLNQKDEDSLPPYEILDPVLNMYVVDDMAIDDIVERGYSKKLVKRVARLVDRAEYKRRQGPPGIRITPKAFGKDRRMPITNLYR